MLTKVWRVTSGRNSLVSIENVDTLSIYKIFIYKRIQSDIAWKKKSLNIECLCDKFSDINSYSFSFISNYLSFKLFFNTFFIATRKKKVNYGEIGEGTRKKERYSIFRPKFWDIMHIGQIFVHFTYLLRKLESITHVWTQIYYIINSHLNSNCIIL